MDSAVLFAKVEPEAYWPRFPNAGHYFKNSNYSQLASLEIQLKEKFEQRDTFAAYIESALPIITAFAGDEQHRH